MSERRPNETLNPADKAKLLALADADVTHEVLTELKGVADRNPENVEAQALYLNACRNLGEMRGYEVACERLYQLDEELDDLAFSLGGAYLANHHPALALAAFRGDLERFADHPKAPEVRETVERLEAAMAEYLEKLMFEHQDEEESTKLALLNEEMAVGLEINDLDRARDAAEELLRRQPGYPPALNNLTIIDWTEDRIDEAIARTEEVLERQPGNIPALHNQVRLELVRGRPEAAREVAERAVEPEATGLEPWVYLIEIWTFLGEFQRALDTFERAAEVAELDPRASRSFALLHHHAAVAAAFLGDERRARELWSRGMLGDAHNALIRDNLLDLDAPPAEQNGPWAQPLSAWINARLLQQLFAIDDEDAEGTPSERLETLFEERPELGTLVPIMLERGDRFATEIAMNLALMKPNAERLEALRRFVPSRRGADRLRLQAIDALTRLGELDEPRPLLWIEGQQRPAIPQRWEMVDPEDDLPEAAAGQLDEAKEALEQGYKVRAERLIQRALELAPDHPMVLLNLAEVMEAQNRNDDAIGVLEAAFERGVDAPLIRATLALNAIVKKDDVTRARELLAPALERDRLTPSELNALGRTSAAIAEAEGDQDEAAAWISLVERSITTS